MIPMVDLHAQHLRLEAELQPAIDAVMASCQFVRGAEVGRFEQELAQYLGCKHVVSCGNGTDALRLAFMALGIGEGDEVITSAYSFIAAAEAVAICGARPVFADIDPTTFNIDPSTIEPLITERTRAIVPVHLFGRPCDMQQIMDIARRHNLYVIEDMAQAMGASTVVDGERRMLGTIGTVGCTSFFPSKNLSCMGDGGALMLNDDMFADRARMLANHGSHRKYYNECIGINSRLDTLQAAVLSVKLRHIDEFTQRRREAAAAYGELLAGIDGIELPEIIDGHVCHQYTLRIKNNRRDALRAYLSERGISTMIYFPLSLNRQQAFSAMHPSQCPQSEQTSQEALSLPIHSEITRDTVATVAQTVREWSRTI